MISEDEINSFDENDIEDFGQFVEYYGFGDEEDSVESSDTETEEEI